MPGMPTESRMMFNFSTPSPAPFITPICATKSLPRSASLAAPAAVIPATRPAVAPRPMAVEAFCPCSNRSAMFTMPTAMAVPVPTASAPAAIPPAAATPSAAATEPAMANRNLCMLGLFLAYSPYLANLAAMSGYLAAILLLISSNLASNFSIGLLLCSMPPNLLNHTSLILSLAAPTASTPLPSAVRFVFST